MSNILNINEQDYVFIGQQSIIKGSLSFYGETRIAGTVVGDISTLSSSPLTIEPHGKVEGDITCHDITVFGEVSGSISASGTLTVHPYGKVTGTVSANSFAFKPGSIINIDGQVIERP